MENEAINEAVKTATKPQQTVAVSVNRKFNARNAILGAVVSFVVAKALETGWELFQVARQKAKARKAEKAAEAAQTAEIPDGAEPANA